MGIESSTSKILSDKSSGASVVSRKYEYSDITNNLAIHPIFGDITRLTDLDAIKRSIRNLVLARKGSRPFNSDLGSDVENLLFENPSPFIRKLISDYIRNVITEYEPRVSIINIDIVDASEINSYYVSLEFSVKDSIEEEPHSVDIYLKRLR